MLTVRSGFLTTSHHRRPRCRDPKLLPSRRTCPSSAPALVLTGTDLVARAVPRHSRDRSCGRRVSGVLPLRSTVRYETLNCTSRLRYHWIRGKRDDELCNLLTSRIIIIIIVIINAKFEEAEIGGHVECRQDISHAHTILVGEGMGRNLW